MKKSFKQVLQITFFFGVMLCTQFAMGQSYVSGNVAVSELIHEAEMTLVQRSAFTSNSNNYSMLSLEKDLYKYTAKYIERDGLTVEEAINQAKEWLEENATSYYYSINENQKTQLTTELETILVE